MIWIFVGIFLVGTGIGGFGAHRLTVDSYEAEKATIARVNEKILLANNARIDALSNELEVAKNARIVRYKKITKTIEKFVDRPIYRNDCIDDDGLRAVNSIISDRSLDPSKLTPAVRERVRVDRKNWKGAPTENIGTILPLK